MKKLSVLLAATMSLSLFTGCSQSGGTDVYPSRTITWISPSEAGSLADTLGRDASEFLDLGGQDIVISNLVGGSQSVALTALAKSDPDGYTVGVSGYAGLLTQPIQQQVEYSLEDFRYLGCLQSPWTSVIVATPNSGLTSWDDVIERVKNGGEVIYSTGITGGSSHLGILQMMQQSDIQLKYVPYSGTNEVNAALEGNHIDIAIMPISGDNKAKFASGQLVPLVHFDLVELEGSPDVPCCSEYGVDPANYINYDVFCVPKDTPDDVYDYLKTKVDELIQNTEYIERRQASGNAGYAPTFTEEEFTELLYNARDVYEEISIEAGLAK